MRFQLNLSRQPFYNRRLFWLAITLILVMTGFFGAWTLDQIEHSASSIRDVQAKIATQNKELKDLQAKPVQRVQGLNEAQAAQLQAAASLIQQRGFSWTAMLEEFERTLPPTVRIVSIGLKGDKINDQLDVGLLFSAKVFTKTPEDVTKMIAKMDQRGVFRIQPNTQLPPNQNGDIGFDLDVTYVPPKHQAKPVTKDKKASKASNVQPDKADKDGEEED